MKLSVALAWFAVLRRTSSSRWTPAATGSLLASGRWGLLPVSSHFRFTYRGHRVWLTRVLLGTLLLGSCLPGVHAQIPEPDAAGVAPDSAGPKASAVTPKQSRATQLSQAYGFLIGQQASLNLIFDKFPELAVEARQAWFAFNTSALGECEKGVDTELSRQLGEKWPEVREKLTAQIKQLAVSQPVSKEKAAAVLFPSDANTQAAERILKSVQVAEP